MKRRSFIASLFASAAAPVVAKAIPVKAKRFVVMGKFSGNWSDLDYLEHQKFTVGEIARTFRIPASKLSHINASTTALHTTQATEAMR